jgi:hypothetical protein
MYVSMLTSFLLAEFRPNAALQKVNLWGSSNIENNLRLAA